MIHLSKKTDKIRVCAGRKRMPVMFAHNLIADTLLRPPRCRRCHGVKASACYSYILEFLFKFFSGNFAEKSWIFLSKKTHALLPCSGYSMLGNIVCGFSWLSVSKISLPLAQKKLDSLLVTIIMATAVRCRIQESSSDMTYAGFPHIIFCHSFSVTSP